MGAESEGPKPVSAPHDPLDQTQQGQVLGTPAYMAPEQAEGHIDKIDKRTDVYALGTILYEILTGEPPFRGPSVTDVIRKVVTQEPVRPRSINSQAPAALEAVCLKAMSKKREERYPLASDLAREVQRWLADEPVEAYPEPWTRRAARWAKRHRSTVTAAAAIAVLGVATLAVSAVVIRNERNQALLQRQLARQAVDEMYTDVAEQWLEDRSDPLQRKFLDRALAYYERFAEQNARDPAAIQERGRAYQRLGDVRRKLGRHNQAEDAYRKAIEILGPLAQADPNEPDHRHHLARAWAHLGVALFDRAAYEAAVPATPRPVPAATARRAGEPVSGPVQAAAPGPEP
jgi:serine/threonine-protein kinase